MVVKNKTEFGAPSPQFLSIYLRLSHVLSTSKVLARSSTKRHCNLVTETLAVQVDMVVNNPLQV